MIGFFDSGVGGLSILHEVRMMWPAAPMVYLADTANFPYGTKSETDVCILSLTAVDILSRYHPSAIVVACNTASTSALPVLREKYGDVPIIGVVPAIKPAIAKSKTKKVAVLATAATLASITYAELKKTLVIDGAAVIDQACPGWVELVEAGRVDDAQVIMAVNQVVKPLADRQVDTYVLGCTHYPWLRPLIEQAAGPASLVIDSGPAVAKQLARVVKNPETNRGDARETFLCTGETANFNQVATKLLGRRVKAQITT